MSNKNFIKEIEKRVQDTISKFNLISKEDKVGVACSGGKDSITILFILKNLGYNVEAITVDAVIGNYTKQNLENMKNFCDKNNISLKIISFREEFGASLCYLRSVLNSKGEKLRSCTICGVLRRHLLNKYSKKFAYDKIVTGHNKDDEAQAIIMNFFKNDLELLARLGPISGLSKSKQFVTRVKPLYFIGEKDIIKYSKIKKFPVYYGECPCRSGSYRNYTSNLLDSIKKPEDVKNNIIENFLKIMPLLKKHYKGSKKIISCKSCGEPAKDEFCMACKIINKLK